MEVDFSVFKRNFRSSVSISVIGIVVPFALGAAVSVGLYDKFIDQDKVKFGTFLLFIGTAKYALTRWVAFLEASADAEGTQWHYRLPRPGSDPYRVEPASRSRRRDCPRSRSRQRRCVRILLSAFLHAAEPPLSSGWVLLALAIALVNASSGIIILYIILCAVGWILALWFIARPLLVWACRKTGSYGDRGPTEGIMAAVVFLVLTSAWVTDRIGM